MLRIAPLIGRVFVRLRRPLAALMILPCLSIPDFAVDEFHVQGKALRSWIWDLRDPYWHTRYKACGVLGNQGERARAAVPALIAGLHDEEFLVRNAAVSALGEIGTPADVVVSALIPLLEDKSQTIRQVAEGTLEQNLLPKWGRALDAEDLQPILLWIFKTRRPRLQLAAITILGDIHADPHMAMPILREAIHAEADGVQLRAALVLGESHADPRIAVPIFLEGLHAESPLVRGNCLYWLRQLGEDARVAVPTLRKLMQADPSGTVRVHAAVNVWKMERDGESTLPVVLAEMEKEEFDAGAVLFALDEMASVAQPAVPALRAWLQREEDPRVQAAIRRTLASIEKKKEQASSKRK